VDESEDPLAPLARAAQRGDDRAVRELLRAVAPTVLAVVRAILGRESADVEDVAQDAFVGLLHGLDAFRFECTVSHYARRVAVRRAAAALRHARALRRASPVAPLDDDLPARGTPHDDLLANRQLAQWRVLLTELPVAQAEALAMKVVLGYSLEEIAQATGVPVNTVRSRMLTAKETMRQRIERDPRLADLAEAIDGPS